MMSSNLLFARITFSPTLDDFFEEGNKLEQEKKRLLKVISWDTDILKHLVGPGKSKISKKNVEWKFGGVQEGEDYIYGRIAKCKGHIASIADNVTKDFKPEYQREAFVCNFLIDLRNHVFAYESKRNVGEKAPLWIISGVYNGIYGSEMMKLNLITDKRKITKRINELSVITSVKLSLVPTNPDMTPSSTKMDALIRNLHATRITIEASSGSGLDLKGEDGLLNSGLALAEEGYGSAKVTGLKEKSDGLQKEEVINSYNLPVKEKAELDKNDGENIVRLKNIISSVINILKDFIPR
ncbi:MAG: hypothetical protein CVV31_03940 [Methanomicrobiales archaeon HGW-Methanomicrobiales-2]|jgi:hypothetical protein|nr:MAG: hypothetical protein CVV31_03940 [Methanomicrobiales archaeon HGW-Methanomicrobiales-2]